MNRHQSRIAMATSSGPLSQRMNSGRPAAHTPLVEGVDHAVGGDRPADPPAGARFSRVNLRSRIDNALSGRPSSGKEVASKMKSRAQTWFGRSARSRAAGTVLIPNRRRLGPRAGTRSPSSRQIRCTRLWFTRQPSWRSSARDPPVTRSAATSAPATHPPAELLLRGQHRLRWPALGGSVLSQCPARPALRDPEPARWTRRTVSRRRAGLDRVSRGSASRRMAGCPGSGRRPPA